MTIPKNAMYVPFSSQVTIAFELVKSCVGWGFIQVALFVAKVVLYSLVLVPVVVVLGLLFPGLIPVWIGLAGTSAVVIYAVRKAWRGFDL